MAIVGMVKAFGQPELFRLLASRPEDRIAQKLNVSRMIVRVAVMAESEAHDPGFRMLDSEDLGIILVL
jgi:hypothetical protein